jgi:hypothetical protein
MVRMRGKNKQTAAFNKVNKVKSTQLVSIAFPLSFLQDYQLVFLSNLV